MSQVSSATMMRIHSQNSQVTPVLFDCCISAFPVHLHSSKRLWRGPSDPFNTIPFSIERVNVTAGIKHAMRAGREESPFCLKHNCKYPCRQRRPPFYYPGTAATPLCGEISRTTEQKIVIQWMTASLWHDRGGGTFFPRLRSSECSSVGSPLNHTWNTLPHPLNSLTTMRLSPARHCVCSCIHGYTFSQCRRPLSQHDVST